MGFSWTGQGKPGVSFRDIAGLILSVVHGGVISQ